MEWRRSVFIIIFLFFNRLLRKTGESVDAVDVHRATTADSLATGFPKCKRRVVF